MGLKRLGGPFSSKKAKISEVLQVLNKNSDKIKGELVDGKFYDLFDICVDEVAEQIVKEKKDKKEEVIIQTAIDILKDRSIDMVDNLSNKRYNTIRKFVYEYDNMEDNRDASALIDNISNVVDDSFYDFINEFIKNEHKEPTIADFEDYIEYFVDMIVGEYLKEQENADTTDINENSEVNNSDELNDNQDSNSESNDNLFKEYNIEYSIEQYEDMDKAIQDLQSMVKDYNSKNPSTPININIIDNTIHASIKGRTITSELNKLAANSVWELLRELNFDFDWIQNNQQNGVTATFYEGQLTESGMTYNNTQHFIVYYDGPVVAKSSRLKRVADQLLLEAPEQPLLLPEPNYYYVILNDAFGCSIDKSSNDIEKACQGIKKFSNFADAEKWILSEKSSIVAREGNSIPDDGGTWKKHEESIYEDYYNETGTVPSNQKTEYSITISLSNTTDAKNLYKEWEQKYKNIL